MIIKRMIRSGSNRQIQRIGFWTFNIVVGINLIIFSQGIVKADTVSDAQQMLNQNAVSTRSLDLTQKTNSIMPLAVSTASITHSGVSGTASWDIDSTGKLTIHAGKLAAGKGNWSPYASSITSIYVEEGVTPYNEFAAGEKTSNPVFSDLPNVTKIDVTNLDVSQTVTLGQMFQDDKKLQQITGLDKWDTQNCMWMASMFQNNYALTSLDLSHFDTKNVEGMSSMFTGCSSLALLDISNFNTSKVYSMGSMFNGVKGKITGLNNFDTSNVESLNLTFEGVDFTLTDPNDIKDWNTSKVTSLSYTFASAKFNSLDLSNWDFSKVTDMSYMFSGDSNIAQVKDIANWDVSKVEKIDGIFQNVGDKDLSVINNWDVSNVTRANSVFNGCSNLTSLDISQWNMNNVVQVSQFLKGCKLLNEDNTKGYEKLVTSNVKIASALFENTGFMTLDLSKYDTSNISDFSRFFMGTNKLKKIIGKFDTSKATDMSQMFSGSTVTDFSDFNAFQWDVSNAVSMSALFQSTKITDFSFLKEWDVSNVTNLSNIFFNNSVVKYIPIGNWNVSKVENFYYSFKGVSSLEDLPIDNWKTTNAKNMEGMFWGTSSLKSLNISQWDTSRVTNFFAMFNSMDNLESLDLSNWDMTKAEDVQYMFGGDKKLWKITLGPKNIIKIAGNVEKARLLDPVAGTSIQDSNTTESYRAISDKWQEVDPDSGGTDHAPVGDVISADDIMDKYATPGNPVTTYVWQQQPKVNLEMSVPDLDFGTTSNASGVVSRKTKDFAVTVDNKNYPEEAFDAKLSVALVKPLTDSFDSSKTLNDVLIFRNEQNTDSVLSNSPTEVYNGPINFGTNQLSWDDKHGLLLNMNNDRYAQNGHYSGTLEWELTNSL